MKSRIDRIAYVGWRGIHGCEVLDLDKGPLTGLIGPTGAGKSTLVMCMDYALLPDRKVLDIRPISDVQDSQKAGIDSLAARINPKHGYAYVVLDVTTRQDTRLIAGIFVQTIDGRAVFTRWLIRNAPHGMSLHDMLSITEGDHEYHPDFPELKRHLAANSIDVTTCRSVGEYGQALYEAGILPSGMSMGADRSLYANLIETTFKGGISHDVASHLKQYLLPEATQIPEIVRGLEECTNEVIKTRCALEGANKELELLKSTYGVGQAIALNSLHWMHREKIQLTESVHQKKVFLENRQLTHQGLGEAIPLLDKEIEAALETKKSVLASAILELKTIGETVTLLTGNRPGLKIAAATAKAQFAKFNKYGKAWVKITGTQHEDKDYEWAKEWFGSRIKLIMQEIAAIDVTLSKLQEESDRLSTQRASASSEVLAERVGGRSLEQALGNVDEKDAIALELGLCGLVDGVVDVDINVLSQLPATDDLPATFWLGKNAPEPDVDHTHEVGEWLLCIAAGGYVVTAKNRAPVFGLEARNKRRQTILYQIDEALEDRGVRVLELQTLELDRDKLLEEKEGFAYYLENRLNAQILSEQVESAGRELDRCQIELDKAIGQQSDLSEKIKLIQKPHEDYIQKLQEESVKKKTTRLQLGEEIQSLSTQLAVEDGILAAVQQEMDTAAEILGGDFEQMLEASLQLEDFSVERIVGAQARRIAELGVSLSDEPPTRLAVLQSVNAEDRVSTLRIWPVLMDVVRERIDSDLADMDGNTLIQKMQKRRANLGGELVKQENEVKIKARNISVAINSAVNTQRKKIEKLSELGENIKFGNVTGIQLKLSSREKMLENLESFSRQISLFSAEKTVDEALKEFFSAASGKDIDMTGEALLDYRNYVDLSIEARRKGGDWEPAADLSGGESIGCGLAIALMLTRSIASKGEIKVDQIHPLFAIDEVHRLDPAGQSMIVAFAEREGFQVLVTAATLAPGYSCTLYALNRISDPEERLIIRGVKVKSLAVA